MNNQLSIEMDYALPKPKKASPYDSLKEGDVVLVGEWSDAWKRNNYMTEEVKRVNSKEVVTRTYTTIPHPQFPVKVEITRRFSKKTGREVGLSSNDREDYRTLGAELPKLYIATPERMVEYEEQRKELEIYFP